MKSSDIKYCSSIVLLAIVLVLTQQFASLSVLIGVCLALGIGGLILSLYNFFHK